MGIRRFSDTNAARKRGEIAVINARSMNPGIIRCYLDAAPVVKGPVCTAPILLTQRSSGSLLFASTDTHRFIDFTE